VLLLSAARPAPAEAGDSAAADSLKFSTAAYLWGSGVKGDLEARGTSTDVRMSFADILDQLNVGAMGAAQAEWRRWVFLLDALWIKLEEDTGNETVSIAVTPRRSVDVPARVQSQIEQGIVDFKAGYRLFDQPPGSGERRRQVFDLLVGARWWYLKTDIDVRTGPLERNPSSSSDWLDPLIGARLRLDLTSRLNLTVLGDVGGFGIGSASDFTWQVLAIVGWKLGDRWRLHVGYKVLDLDRQQSSQAADVQLYGPVIGASYGF
jgi:hypothetical protein